MPDQSTTPSPAESKPARGRAAKPAATPAAKPAEEAAPAVAAQRPRR